MRTAALGFAAVVIAVAWYTMPAASVMGSVAGALLITGLLGITTSWPRWVVSIGGLILFGGIALLASGVIWS